MHSSENGVEQVRNIRVGHSSFETHGVYPPKQ